MRVFVFGLVSVLMPIYVATLGYGPELVGLVLAVIVAGNVVANTVVVRLEARLGRRALLHAFSALMLLSGVVLFLTTWYPAILLACFLGNISTTGSEAGPFQSIETGLLPRLVPDERRNWTFGVYNLVGYGASSVGALAAATPALFHGDLLVFRLLFLGFGLVGVLLAVLYRGLPLEIVPRRSAERPPRRTLEPEVRREVTALAVLFSMDSFGGGFVSQSLLSYWFYFVYGVSLSGLGVIFLVVNLITAGSIVGATLLADRIGNLRTMVYSHLLSNVFLVLIPFAGSLAGSLVLLFARQSVSQMDVPTRQAFVAGLFRDEDRVTANATTNAARSATRLVGAPATGLLLGAGYLVVPFVLAGLTKIAYDLLIFVRYRHRDA